VSLIRWAPLMLAALLAGFLVATGCCDPFGYSEMETPFDRYATLMGNFLLVFLDCCYGAYLVMLLVLCALVKPKMRTFEPVQSAIHVQALTAGAVGPAYGSPDSTKEQTGRIVRPETQQGE
jgi:hypothetical protein